MVALSTPAFAQAAGAGGLNLIDIAQNMSGIAIAVAVILFIMSFWSVGVAIERGMLAVEDALLMTEKPDVAQVMGLVTLVMTPYNAIVAEVQRQARSAKP